MIRHFPMDIETQKNKISPDPIAIWSITPNGKILGQKIKDALEGSVLFVSVKIGKDDQNIKNTLVFEKLSREIQRQFNKFPGHVFIFSTGIAIRIIAPLLDSKITDPAIVVADDNGNHVISLLSGHLGGANELSKKIAGIVCGRPVITTATDTNKIPAIDMIAKNKGLLIETPRNIKHINMAFLMGENVNVHDPFGFIQNDLPKTIWTNEKKTDGSKGKIFCSHETKEVSRETLILRPPVLSVGIGCNRGTSLEELKQFLFMVLKKEKLSVNSICQFATTDIKKDETGLLLLSETMKKIGRASCRERVCPYV